MAAEWYFRVMGTEFGPVSPPELVQQAADGKITPDTEVRKGDAPWVPASKVAGLFDRAAQAKASATRASSPPLPEAGSVFVPSSDSTSASSPSPGRYEVLDSAEADGF